MSLAGDMKKRYQAITLINVQNMTASLVHPAQTGNHDPVATAAPDMHSLSTPPYSCQGSAQCLLIPSHRWW